MSLEISERILLWLDQNGDVDTLVLASDFEEDHQKVVGAMKSLLALGELITSETITSKKWALSTEGAEVAANGSHEALVFNAIPAEGISQAAIMKVGSNGLSI